MIVVALLVIALGLLLVVLALVVRLTGLFRAAIAVQTQMVEQVSAMLAALQTDLQRRP